MMDGRYVVHLFFHINGQMYYKDFIVLIAALEPVRLILLYDTEPNHWCGGSYLRADRIISVKRRAVHFDDFSL
ncbi:MAG: hypothetical protein K2M94_04810, partial [Paramuribaculum sp.]|nr:hypothetical protein [Paramuribaculum sp.]